MASSSEFALKNARVADWLVERGVDAVLFAAPANVSWLGCGGELIRTDSPVGFLVTTGRCLLLSPSDDADRLRQEEVRGLGAEILPYSNLGAEALAERARDLVASGARAVSDTAGLGFDFDPSSEALRRRLLPEEIERLRRLGRDAAAALEEVAAECYRGILERDAAARLAAECVRRQITPKRILAGADERLESYPYPLPKGGSAERVLMLSLVGTRGGLHVALSRTICLASADADFVERFDRSSELAARLRSEARAGEILGPAVQRALPQPSIHVGSLGAVTGYALPEVEVRSTSNWPLAAGQAIAWAVVTPGIRCEDTDILDADGTSLATATEDWPRHSFVIGGRTYEVPDLLQM